MINILIKIGVIAAIVVGVIILLRCIYRVADVDKALIITGGKEPKIKVSGGGFVIPIFRKASYFDLCMLTVKADKDELRTLTNVPVIVDWTAQIRPEIKDIDILKKAIVSFKERGEQGIIEDVKLTIMGSVRSIVATLTPEQVQGDKDSFKNEVEKVVRAELLDMGLELVSLNFQDVNDRNGYYENMAAIDMESKRLNAEKVRATTDQNIREQQAESDRIAKEKELAAALAIAEKTRDNDIKQAEFKAETDKAKADAEIAGALQRTIREQELSAQQGQVEVVRREQANLAAQKDAEIMKTKAEAEKVEESIKAEKDAAVATINAEAQAKIAETEALGKAKANEAEAEGKAKAIALEAEANAKRKRIEGDAEAEIIEKKGLANAAAIKAEKLAEAEGERALAEARAANGQVNFEIEKIRIEADARVQIATNAATIMAEIGKNAEFVNIGGGSGSNGTGNVLLDTMAGIPQLMKRLNVENEALNGKPYNEEINDLVAALADPIKGLLSQHVTNNTTNNTTIAPDAPTI